MTCKSLNQYNLYVKFLLSSGVVHLQYLFVLSINYCNAGHLVYAHNNNRLFDTFLCETELYYMLYCE